MINSTEKEIKVRLKNRVGIKGMFKIDAVNVDTGHIRSLAPLQKNIILDKGLDNIGTSAGGPFNYWASYCHVGTGNSTPTTSQTALDAYVAKVIRTTETYEGRSLSSPWTVESHQIFDFPQGAAEGNLAEIALGGAVTGNISTRSLIKDEFGTPTTVTVLGDEFLRVTYILVFHFKSGDTAYADYDFGGSLHSGEVRAALADTDQPSTIRPSTINNGFAYDGSIGAEDSSPSGASATLSVAVDAYVPGSHERTATLTAGLGVANFASGTTAIYWSDYLGSYQASISPAIIKTSSQVLTFNVSTSWGRA